MKKLKYFIITFTFLCCALLYACEFNPIPSKEITISGSVYINTEPAVDVQIKSKTQVLCETDENGNFTFTVNAESITIFIEKSGYLFTPNTLTFSESTSDVLIKGEEVENLNGILSLSSINITPSSIVSISENFQYVANGNNCLKAKNFYVEINNKKINCLTFDTYLVKNKNNVILVEDDLFVETGIDFTISFSLDAYFKLSFNEYIFTEEKQSIINIDTVQTTAMLNENNQIEYTYVGVNSSNNKFSYNVTFTFDYYPDI